MPSKMSVHNCSGSFFERMPGMLAAGLLLGVPFFRPLKMLGHPHPRLYRASWQEWGHALDTPVE